VRCSVIWFGSDDLRRALEDRIEHLFGQLSGRSILLTWMIRAEQGRPQVEKYIVTEAEGGNAVDGATVFQDREVRVEGDLAQHDDEPQVCQQLQLTLKIRPAIAQLEGRRLVARRRAVPGGGNPGIGKAQTVVRGRALGPGGETGAVQSAVQEVTGTVSGKHTSGTISAMCGRSQAKNQHPGGRVAERRHGLTPVVPFQEGAPFDGRDFAAMADKTRAFFTLHNLAIEADKSIGSEIFAGIGHENIMTPEPGRSRSVPGSTWKVKEIH